MDKCTEGPRSLPFWDWLVYLSLCKAGIEKPGEDHFLPSGLFKPTPWPVLWLLWSRGAAMAACRGQATSPGPFAAPAELVQGSHLVLVWQGQVLLRPHSSAQVEDVRWSPKAPAPWDCVVPPGGPRSPSHPHPAHRKWLSTVSFVACLGSPVMNRVRLTYQTKTPGRKVTRTSQSAYRRDRVSHPVPSSPCPCPPKRPTGTQPTWSSPLWPGRTLVWYLHSISFQDFKSKSTSLLHRTADYERTQRGEVTQTGSHSRSEEASGPEPSNRNSPPCHAAVSKREGAVCNLNYLNLEIS